MIRTLFRLLSLLMVMILVTVLIANSRQSLLPPEQLVVRSKVNSITLPPPPPPPAPQQQVQQSLKLNLNIASQGPALRLSELSVALSKPALKLSQKPLKALDFSTESMAIDVASFGLDELDDSPRLLTPLQIKFSPQMRQKGVRKVAVKLHVVIDQQGVVLLQAIKENPYPELASALRTMVRRARFTPPKRLGKRVRAEFIWPLVLKE